MSPPDALTSPFFLEAARPRNGRRKSPPRGVGLKLLHLLRDHFPSPLQPAQMAAMLRLPPAGVKKALQRGDGDWCIKTGHGWYRARADRHLLARIGFEPLNVHALQLKVKLSRFGGRPPAARGQRDKETRVWAGRKVTVQPMAGGYFVSLRASTEPLSVMEFESFTHWVDGAFPGAVVTVESYDLAVDAAAHLLGIRGAESVTLGGFRDGLLKAYNKKALDVARFEACFHRLDLKPSEVASMLNEIAGPVRDYAPMPPPDFEPGVV